MKKLFFFCLGILLFTACHHERTNSQQKDLLVNNWEFYYNGEWYPATVPGSIHTDLLANQLIPDPFYRSNEDSLQWISSQTWKYRTRFDKTATSEETHASLVFQGVDCDALFYLNGEPLLHQEEINLTNNMFREWRFALPKNLKDKDNELVITFLPADSINKVKSAQLGYQLPEERAFSRETPYQSGWDWGPKLATCGLWKSCYQELWTSFIIRDLNIVQSSLSDQEAVLDITLEIEADGKDDVTLETSINNQDVEILKNNTLTKGINIIHCQRVIKNPKRWYPNGLGEPNCYDFTVVAHNRDYVDSISKRIGLRTIELDTSKDTIGSKFTFIVNGHPCFMKGANWIPAEFFPAQMTETHYRKLIQSCKDANMNMIRVWGGGYYEDDLFYKLCDEMGIMVWQDFIFSCALYPGDDAFMNNVKQEAIEQIKRLRNHPSLALWCGNNEVKNGWEDWGWQAAYTEKQQAEISNNLQQLFNKLLPDLVKEYDSQHDYFHTSPLWGWGHPECVTEGDSHYWGVWWGELPFEMWEPKTGRFMSEYGFQSYPQLSTVETYTLPEDRTSISSNVMKNHQKHARGIEIIQKAMTTYFDEIPEQTDDFIYLSQLVQSYGVGLALETHRRKMPHCMGSLYWQLNDCWPVASWSSIDYYGNWKALHYEAARQFANVMISTIDTTNNSVAIYIVSDLLEDIQGDINVKLIDFEGNILNEKAYKDITVQANSSSLINIYDMSELTNNQKFSTLSSCLIVSFEDNQKINSTRKIHYFDYPGKLLLSKPEVSPLEEDIVATNDNGKFKVTLRSDYLRRWVYLETTVPGKFSDNYFDLIPNEERTIIFTPDNSTVDKLHFKTRSYHN